MVTETVIKNIKERNKDMELCWVCKQTIDEIKNITNRHTFYLACYDKKKECTGYDNDETSKLLQIDIGLEVDILICPVCFIILKRIGHCCKENKLNRSSYA